MEVDHLCDAGHAHHGDGLVHAARLGAHVALAGARKLRDLLRAWMRGTELTLRSIYRIISTVPCTV